MAVLPQPYCKIVLRYKSIIAAKPILSIAQIGRKLNDAIPAPGDNLSEPTKDASDSENIINYEYTFGNEKVVVLESGANLLSMTQTNGEGERASICQFSFYDNG
ncbi:MAG: hypothetical protein ACRDBG_00800, partial [Waterburya sp.]